MTDRNDAESIRWRKYYNNSEFHPDYPDETLYGMIRNASEKSGDATALDFMGK